MHIIFQKYSQLAVDYKLTHQSSSLEKKKWTMIFNLCELQWLFNKRSKRSWINSLSFESMLASRFNLCKVAPWQVFTHFQSFTYIEHFYVHKNVIYNLNLLLFKQYLERIQDNIALNTNIKETNKSIYRWIKKHWKCLIFRKVTGFHNSTLPFLWT